MQCEKSHALDLFGEIPVTWPEVFTWCKAVAGIELDSWRLPYYIEYWNVPGKVAAAKKDGSFWKIHEEDREDHFRRCIERVTASRRNTEPATTRRDGLRDPGVLVIEPPCAPPPGMSAGRGSQQAAFDQSARSSPANGRRKAVERRQPGSWNLPRRREKLRPPRQPEPDKNSP